MEENDSFRQGLEAVREKARANGNQIGVGEILTCFPHRELGEEEIPGIYRYWEEQGFRLENYKLHDPRTAPVAELPLTGEKKAFFQLYRED